MTSGDWREKADGIFAPFPDPARLIFAKLVFATSLLESLRFKDEDDSGKLHWNFFFFATKVSSPDRLMIKFVTYDNFFSPLRHFRENA